MAETTPDKQIPATGPDQSPKKARGGSCLKRLFWFAVFIFIAGGAASIFMLEYVRPNEYGIMEKRIGINSGIQKKEYSAGYHIVFPYDLWIMHRLPKDYQVLELTNHPNKAAMKSHLIKAAHIQTSDGFYVDVDVSILYKITEPYKVLTTLGPGENYRKNGIVPRVEPKLKDTLGDLTTEEFFNSHLRVEKSEDAKNKLNEELSQYGMKVEHVLVRYFNYSEEIQKNIEAKKLKDQLVFKNQSEAKAATEEAIVKKIEQEGKAAVVVELEKGKAYVTRRIAEKDQYARKKKAEADLLVKLADADKVRLKNNALQGQGAERMVGLKMAEIYRGLDVVILPSDGPAGVNPLDLKKTLKLFDVSKGGAQ